ncbi:MAG: hypothetical protein L0Z62_46740 [Gemmataceae bacterium]|nr:hypothetical protein [Gemmataceae bacterium]
MRRAVLVTVAACVLCSGCSLASTAAHNVLRLPAQALEDFSESVRNRKLSDSAWNAVLAAGGTYSQDHAAGFRDGFTDYLRAGGTGGAPTLPPRRYWKVRYQTPQGARAVADWFAGFRHGAAMAMASGYRQWVTIPVGGGAPDLPPPQLAPVVPPQELLPPPVELAPPPQKALVPLPQATLGQPLQPTAPNVPPERASEPVVPQPLAQPVRASLGPPIAETEPRPESREGSPAVPAVLCTPVWCRELEELELE